MNDECRNKMSALLQGHRQQIASARAVAEAELAANSERCTALQNQIADHVRHDADLAALQQIIADA
jgi:hypothetical protein